MPIKIDDTDVTDKLTQIREKVGGNIRDSVTPVRADYRPLEITLEEKSSLNAFFHPSGLLVRKGRPVFAYIRDHTTGKFPQDPQERKKVHFAWCKTLTYMRDTGKWESRYHVTNRTDNLYYVDARKNPWSTESQELQKELYPCKHCLHEVEYRCYNSSSPENQKIAIVKSFDAKEAYDLLKQHFDTFREYTRNLRRDTMPAGYAPNHRDISRRYRASKNHVCDECGRKGSARTTEMHHKDGNKRNNSADNLQCLCKPCHRNMHSHMR